MNQQSRRAELFLKAPRRRRYILVAVLVPLLLTGLVFGMHHEFGRAEAMRLEAVRSYDRRVAALSLLSRLKDAETAQRGYLLTGDPAFLVPYDPARAQIAAMLRPATLWPAGVTRDVAAKFAELDRTIAMARRGDRALAYATVADGRGKQLMDRLRDEIGRIVDAEATTYARDEAAFRRRQGREQLFVTLAVLGLVGVLIASLAMLWRLQRQRYNGLVDTFEAAERHRTILDSTIDAILILNPSGTIEVVNAAATAMLGYPDSELERRDIAMLIDLAPGTGSFHQRIGLVDGLIHRSFLTDLTVRHRDGREIAVDVAMGVMHLPSGDHIVVSLRDIAERKRIERMKDDLMSTVSHELRTPLTSVIGSLGLLRAGSVGPLPAGADRLVEIAENNSRRLIRLINDMLDIDRIESGKLHLARDPTDLGSVVDRACIGSQGLASAKGVRIFCHPFDRPVMVSGDADRLLQVVTNLLSNATRASPAGGTVDVGLTIDSQGRALVFVDDRGPGIPPAFRDRIFGRFERAPREDGSTGTGLGLAISREIVARHDGKLWFEDRAGGGTRFAFALATIGAVAWRDGQAPRVLVCTPDEAEAGKLVAMVLNEGCTYDLARSAAEARAAVARSDHAAVLVDLHLPGEGGLALARQLRAGDPPCDAPIIIVSADAINDGEGLSPLDVVDVIDERGDVERTAAALRTALGRTGSRQPVILHLDDDPDLLAVVAAALAPEARTVTACTMAAARTLLQTVSPDAVILDMQLAHGSGLELVPFLLDANGLAIPTILYSAQEVGPDLAARVDAVLVKARGSIPDLKATVRRVVRGRARTLSGDGTTAEGSA
ncbi:CHASE3 domain-containing protein [Sphingomonas sp. KR1UV-12]|uniref:histidine kinase n=1 Tax=Sphingomonas aurea TaxID=3063994 RepID=A0ABT9EFP0_9SPHN|nr:ATP-binding protein [Sphingomonas sp. KR1UV-12]MDP1025787.1 CHASE3 domain-containing protein [Sphingomonas sp. KR1UV-12]